MAIGLEICVSASRKEQGKVYLSLDLEHCCVYSDSNCMWKTWSFSLKGENVRIKVIVLAACFLLAIGCAPVAKPTAQQQQQQQTVIVPGGADTTKTGTLMLRCVPEDSEVYVGGAFAGNAPINMKLEAGIHIIEVKKKGHADYRREVRVFGDSESSLEVKLVPNQ